REGDEGRAARLWRQARGRVARLGMPPDHIYFDALCSYHDQSEELAEQLAARDHELSLLENKGRWGAEGPCRVERCKLKARLRLSVDRDVADACSAARKLRAPAAALEELERITGKVTRLP